MSRLGGEYRLFTFNGAPNAQSFGETLDLPSWADFIDIENDGGRPLLCDVGNGEAIAARTGMRIPLGSRSIRITVDNDANAPLTNARARIACLSERVAQLTPPPSDKPNRVFQQRETVVQAGAARLVTYREGIRLASVRFPTVNGTAVGQIFIADTIAKCSVALGIELLPGDAFEDWTGPLFVFRPAAASNGELDVTQAVKDLGGFT